MASRQKFEGRDVVAVECRVTGGVGDARLNDKLSPGTRVVLVAEGVVSRTSHVLRDEGLVRVQAVKVAEGYVITDQLDADDLLHKLRAERRAALDELLGRQPIDGFPEDDKE
jgi:hypothetical protein